MPAILRSTSVAGTSVQKRVERATRSLNAGGSSPSPLVLLAVVLALPVVLVVSLKSVLLVSSPKPKGLLLCVEGLGVPAVMWCMYVVRYSRMVIQNVCISQLAALSACATDESTTSKKQYALPGFQLQTL
jgi:hypothetical protein